MLHTLKIERLVPWTKFNEHEGQIEGLIDGHHLLCCYVIMSSAQEWQEYKPGNILEVDMVLLRYDKVTIVDEFTLPTLHQISNVNYEVTGTITQISGDILFLKSVFPLEVDLDIHLGTTVPIPAISIGNQISVVGMFKLDLHPDDD